MRSMAKSSWELTGWWKATRSSLRWEISSRSSRRTTAKVEPAKPCLVAFWAERALPSGVRGPVERAALARLAASCLSDTGMRGPLALRLSMGADVRGREVLVSGGGGRDYFGSAGVTRVQGWPYSPGDAPPQVEACRRQDRSGRHADTCLKGVVRLYAPATLSPTARDSKTDRN